MLNKYDLKMNGIKKASAKTKCLRGFYARGYVQISYDINTGDIFAVYHNCFGRESFINYGKSNIIHVTNADDPLSMQNIADKINNAVQLYTNKAVLYMEG